MIITTIVDTIHRLFVSGSAKDKNVPPSEVSGGGKTFFGIAVSLAASGIEWLKDFIAMEKDRIHSRD